MILITGGAYQGKTAFAKEILLGKYGEASEWAIADGADADEKDMKTARLITNVHLWIARLLKEGKDPYAEAEKLIGENPEVILVVNELGCGVVPVDAFDRSWREATGRICCLFAKESRAVYRVTCGIGTKIR